MRNWIIFFTVLMLPGIGIAGPVFNAFTNSWETPAPESRLQYSPLQKQIVYAPENAVTHYNPYEKTWGLSPRDYVEKYNPHTETWETTSKNAELIYNPLAERWSYQPQPERESLFGTGR